jgi:hypothetical protein
LGVLIMGELLSLVAHLETTGEPLFVPRSGEVHWDDEAWHVQAYHRDPETYALLSLMPGVTAAQRARVLLRLLLASWADLDDGVRATLARVVRILIHGLPGTDVATVLLALRRRRANHKHVTRAALRLLSEHPHVDRLVATHRQVLVACLEHALGKTTARGAVRALIEGRPDDARRQLLRFVDDPERTSARVRALYEPDRSPALDEVAASPSPTVDDATLDLDLVLERPATVTTTNRGDIAATLVHMYRGGPFRPGWLGASDAAQRPSQGADQLREALARYVESAASRVPRFPATLALVVDASASMRGYGDREWALLSQAAALRLVLERVCERLVTVTVGGRLPEAGRHEVATDGGTDLASGVLEAAVARPDLIAVVSDGYENVYPGDLARVLATLPRAGVDTQVLFCHSAFGHSDDLTHRRPAPAVPHKAFWHEADFAPLLLWLLAHAGTPAADAELTGSLRNRLTALERELEGVNQ